MRTGTTPHRHACPVTQRTRTTTQPTKHQIVASCSRSYRLTTSSICYSIGEYQFLAAGQGRAAIDLTKIIHLPRWSWYSKGKHTAIPLSIEQRCHLCWWLESSYLMIKGGKMQGKGFFVLPDKSLLTCSMKGNVICRKARIIYPNGDYFEGEVSNNKAQGKGKLV